MLENFRPPYDATVVAKLKAADAVLIGKTNMDEFAMGGSTENSAFCPDAQPLGPRRASPAAPAAARRPAWPRGMAPLSVGTDTGGSIRQPAGAVRRHRPEADLRPREPLRPGGLRQQPRPDRPVGQTAEDAALLLEVLAGHDPLDSTSVDRPVPPYTRDGPPAARRACGSAWSASISARGSTPRSRRPSARRSASTSRSARRSSEVSLPHSKYAVATYYIIAPCEASSNLARYDGVHYGYRTDEKQMVAELAAERKQLRSGRRRGGAAPTSTTPLVRMYRRSRAEGFGPEVKRRIMLGTYALSAGYYDAYYLKALKVRRLIRQDFDEAFERGRPDRRPGHADAGVQDRREGRRSAGDVPVRPLHGQHEPGRHRRHLDPLRLQSGGLADRPAPAGPAVRGRTAAARRRTCSSRRPTGTRSSRRCR